MRSTNSKILKDMFTKNSSDLSYQRALLCLMSVLNANHASTPFHLPLRYTAH